MTSSLRPREMAARGRAGFGCPDRERSYGSASLSEALASAKGNLGRIKCIDNLKPPHINFSSYDSEI